MNKEQADAKLLDACRTDNVNRARDAIAMGASTKIEDEFGWTPLHYAVVRSQREMVSLLLSIGADVNAPASNPRGWSPLHAAAQGGNKHIASELIARGARVDATDIDGITPLHQAAMCGNAEVVDILIRNGADIHATDPMQNTPLHVATNVNVVKLLIDHGADVTAANIEAQTAWDIASSHGNTAMAAALLDALMDPGHAGRVTKGRKDKGPPQVG